VAEENPQPLAHHEITTDVLADIRADAAQIAVGVGLDEERAAGFALAVTEVATNSIRHGGGDGALDVGQDDDRVLYAEVVDHGHGGAAVPTDMPAPGELGGRGLWISRELSDRMHIDSGPDGTTVRLEMTLGDSTLPAGPPPAVTPES
jgi:anti-sigma regulatory factor (Ser/Thr protein kinase)